MTRDEPDGFVRPEVDALAHILLQYARDDISLVRRTRRPAKSVRLTETQPQAVLQHDAPALTLLSPNTDPASRQYLEDLVSIAVASAERADSVLLEAHATRAKAVRAICTFSSIAAAGMALGVFGMVGFHSGRATDQKLVEIAGRVQSLDQQQESATHQLAAVRSEVADQRKAVTEIQQAASPAQPDASDAQATTEQRVTPAPDSQPIMATSLGPVREATYSAPWPEHSRTGQAASYSSSWPPPSGTAQATSYSSTRPAPVQPAWSARRRQVRVPPFLIAIQQDLRMLFR
jgi:hypothetical protein